MSLKAMSNYKGRLMCVPPPDFMLFIHSLSVFRLNYSVSITSNSLRGNTAGCFLEASSGKKKHIASKLTHIFIIYSLMPMARMSY